MTKSLSYMLAILALTACKATDPPGSGSSSSSQSSSSSNGTSQYNDFSPQIGSGETVYENSCMLSGCHGPNGAGANDIRWSIYDNNSKLHRYIEDTMPKGNSASCVGQCAADISAYLGQFRVFESACSDSDSVQFSERALPLLTPYEYKNSILDLFDNAAVPEDYLDPLSVDKTMGFPNSRNVKVSKQHGNRYFNNANNIAGWNQQNGVVRCSSTDRTSCATEFVDDFARRAFRRPLTGSANQTNSEVWYFHQIFNDAPSVNEGLKWAIIGALTSPHFLYRSELGVLTSDATGNALFAAGSPTGGIQEGELEDFEPAGNPITVNGTDFTTDNGEPRTRGGQPTHLLWTNGSASRTFEFSGADIITISAGGNDYNNSWPTMTIQVNNQQIASETVATPSYDLSNFQYLVLGQQGNLTLQITFNNDGGASGAQGEAGTDIDLYIGDVSVTPAQLRGTEAIETRVDFTDKLQSLSNDSAAYVLDPYEMASVLSYLLTGSAPDEELFAAAEAGALNSKQGITTQVHRLLGTPKAEAHMKYFVALWFRAEKLETNAALPDGIAEDMVRELQEFFWHIFANENVPFKELYSADYSFLNRRLAEHYGINSGNTSDNQFVKTTLPETRGGIPTLGAFLASFAHGSESAPILRGVHVREDMLCHHIGPPPSLAEDDAIREQKAAEAQAAMASRTLTTRAFYHISTDSEGCGSCHYEDINPLGFAMADFDGLGVFREQQIAIGTADDGEGVNWVPIDASGALWDPEVNQFTSHTSRVEVNGARELSLALAETESVQFCLTEKAFRMAINRPFNLAGRDLWNTATDRVLTPVEAESFACAQEQLSNALKTSNQSLQSLFETLANLDLLRFRR